MREGEPMPDDEITEATEQALGKPGDLEAVEEAFDRVRAEVGAERADPDPPTAYSPAEDPVAGLQAQLETARAQLEQLEFRVTASEEAAVATYRENVRLTGYVMFLETVRGELLRDLGRG